MKHEELIRQALLIRRFEERLLDLFKAGSIFGTVHTCIGQEWSAVALAQALRSDDLVFSNHRGHGHFLARTGNVKGLLAEIMGRTTGVCGGIGGSQHLHVPGFYSNGIQGGMAPVAVGAALAEQRRKSGRIVTLCIGDGTWGEGVLYEALNIASKWRVPLLVLVENNHIAQSTPVEQTMAGSIVKRAESFDISWRRADTWNWPGLLNVALEVADAVRHGGGTMVLEVDTFRLMAHSKGDDTREPSKIREYELRDPLNLLLAEGGADMKRLEQEIKSELAAAYEAVCSDPFPQPPTLARPTSTDAFDGVVSHDDKGRMVELINQALREGLKQDERVLLLGEDILTPYGGAFKAMRGLSDEFPGRVLATPISEAALIGVGSGLALRGYLPVVEIMFGDFVGLGFDQIVNHACKFEAMYNGQVRVPLIVRTPMGGRRGYGPTHSQSLEKHLLGTPGLTILALNVRISPRRTYQALLREVVSPTLVVENKVLYTRFLRTDAPAGFRVTLSDETYPVVQLTPIGKNSDVTVFCYGGMLEDVENAVSTAFDESDIICEVICPTLLQPVGVAPIVESVARTGRLLTVEEGPVLAGVGAEMIAHLAESGVPMRNVRRLGHDGIIPCCARLEKQMLPGVDAIVACLRTMMKEP